MQGSRQSFQVICGAEVGVQRIAARLGQLWRASHGLQSALHLLLPVSMIGLAIRSIC